MLNEDNIGIKYLMNELDPSEAMLVEKAMMEDQDLLIEIECLRETLKKVDKLPSVQPPQEISEKVLQTAAEQCSHSKLWSQQSNKFQQPKYYAAAAILIAGVTIGSLTFEVYPNLLTQSDAVQMAEQKSKDNRAVSDQAVFNQTGTIYLTNQSSSTSEVEPWVDNNDVLHYSESGDQGFSFINDSIKKESMKKLKPINEPVHFYSQPQSFQLTGSPR